MVSTSVGKVIFAAKRIDATAIPLGDRPDILVGGGIIDGTLRGGDGALFA